MNSPPPSSYHPLGGLFASVVDRDSWIPGLKAAAAMESEVATRSSEQGNCCTKNLSKNDRLTHLKRDWCEFTAFVFFSAFLWLAVTLLSLRLFSRSLTSSPKPFPGPPEVAPSHLEIMYELRFYFTGSGFQRRIP